MQTTTTPHNSSYCVSTLQYEKVSALQQLWLKVYYNIKYKILKWRETRLRQ